MSDFFKGRRRKIGLALLMIALLVTVAWMRSAVITDRLYFRKTLVESTGGVLQLFATSSSDVLELEWEPLNRQSYHSNHGVLAGETFWRPVWHHKLWDIQIGYVEDRSRVISGSRMAGAHVAIVPYYALLFPLTLLSAWLLLVKALPVKLAASNQESPRAND